MTPRDAEDMTDAELAAARLAYHREWTARHPDRMAEYRRRARARYRAGRAAEIAERRAEAAELELEVVQPRAARAFLAARTALDALGAELGLGLPDHQPQENQL